MLIRIGYILAAAMLASAGVAQTQSRDREHEGDWYVSDDTDNNTGERKVWAFQTTDPKIEDQHVQLEMRCVDGKPTFYVDWLRLQLPDRAVLTIGVVKNSDAVPAEVSYVFEKHEGDYNGMRASPNTSSDIVAAIGSAKYATVTAHLSTGSRSVGVEVDGTQRAWSRVSRHCPVRIMAQPPM